ncbi:DUF5018 domain-containing protein [Flavobacterium sp. CLA17]|uniref:DUF5018 domain-containing protein n=1 Tax=Flavobacterium sp. CLA17 TaxID=2724135 RepID=UPI0014925D1A|nr:DUF5018 domain-containing protein [Flavobacterium sp. CLA17]QSB27609.1 hypothetical protein HAV12_002370 [Flavobacterium sp. CLA17]
MKTKKYLFPTLLFFSLLMFSCVSEEKLSAENTIQSFSISRGGVTKDFTVVDNSITGKVESTFELNDLSLSVLIPTGATISPEPNTIKSINGSFTLVVTAENGDKKTYNVNINREPSVDNFILEFNIKTPDLMNASINKETGLVTRRLPEFVDLKNLSVDLKYSKYASISPDPASIKDYSSPVNFTVKSESGIEKIYQVKLERMDVNRTRSCTEANAWKWFGGDDRTDAPDLLPYDRNVSTGQTIILDKDLVPSVFSVNLREGFYYYENSKDYNQPVVLKLIIRDASLNVLATTTTGVSGVFSGGFIPFDLQKLNLLLEANKTYVFYWYLVDGEKLGITASSPGNNKSGSGFCFNSGYSGESKVSENTNIEDSKVMFEHPWHFSIELEGKE